MNATVPTGKMVTAFTRANLTWVGKTQARMINVGQAKQRGSYDERKKAAEQREADVVALREARWAEKERNMTPEERTERQRQRTVLTSIMGFTAGMLP